MALVTRITNAGDMQVPLASEFDEVSQTTPLKVAATTAYTTQVDEITSTAGKQARLLTTGLNLNGQADETVNLVPSTYDSAVTETTTATDTIVGERVWYGAVSETVTSADTLSGTVLSYITTGLQVMLDAGNPSSYPGSGTTWTDVNPNGYTPQNFTLVSTTYSSTSGGYLTFNGTSSYAYSTYSYAPYTTLDATTTTYCCWVRMSNLTSGRKIFGFEYVQSGTGGGFSYDKQVYLATSGQLVWGVYNGGYRLIASQAIDTTWLYIAVVYNAATPLTTFYVNGVRVGTLAYNSADQGTWLRFGSYRLSGWSLGSDGYWPGDMAIFQKYLGALTQAQLRTNYEAWAPRFGKSTGLVTSGLRLYLNANNYSGSGAWLDQSGNGYNMTLFNSPAFTSSATTPYFSFNGSNQYMNNASFTQAAITTSTNFTWIGLIYPNSNTNAAVVFGARTASLNFCKLSSSTFEVYPSSTNAALGTAAWKFVAVVKSGTSVYVYNSAANQSISTSFTGTTSSTIPFYIGGDPTASEWFNGRIAMVAVYNRALSFSEVLQMDYFTGTNYGT